MKAIIEKFLETNNYKNERVNFENLFLSHPNYPSLYAVTDTFDLLGIENVAAKVPKEQFSELPSSYLAVVNDEVVLVKNQKNTIIIEKQSEIKKMATDEFLIQWNGVVVAIDPNEVVEKKKSKLFKSKYLLIGFLLLGVLVLQSDKLTWSYVLNYLLLSIGLLLSFLIIDEKLNKTEGVISKICSFSANTSCDSVIKSNSGNITSWLDFSDLPILFFATSFFALLINASSLSLMNFISLLSLPIVGYSIWLQKIKLEKWCVLCLAVSFILIFQSVLFVTLTTDLTFDYIALVVSGLIIFSLWFFIKPFLSAKSILTKDNLELLKFKRNYSIFSSLQKDVKHSEELNSLHKIQLGNSEAKIIIDLILSPTCGHCHTAFEEGMNLLKNFPNKIKLAVFFNLNPDNGENPYFSIAENLLQINKEYPEKIQEAISDWHIQKMDLKQWKSKWEQKDITLDIEQNLRKQYEWCLSNDFNYTPVKIVNGKLFPNEYELSELKYFISELEDIRELEIV